MEEKETKLFSFIRQETDISEISKRLDSVIFDLIFTKCNACDDISGEDADRILYLKVLRDAFRTYECSTG